MTMKSTAGNHRGIEIIHAPGWMNLSNHNSNPSLCAPKVIVFDNMSPGFTRI